MWSNVVDGLSSRSLAVAARERERGLGQPTSRDRKGAAGTPIRYIRMTPQTYFLTFSTYGTWLHGDDRGSVDRAHNEPGQPTAEADPALRTYRANLMTDPAYRMDESDRAAVLAAIVRHCGVHRWHLLAAHVRTNHVHLVVTADAAPERMLTEFKSYATRALNDARPDERDRKRWTRHGSTRWLKSEDAVARAVQYTLYEQGEPLAVYPASALDEDPNAPRAATTRERPLPSAGTHEVHQTACDPPDVNDLPNSRSLAVAARGLIETP